MGNCCCRRKPLAWTAETESERPPPPHVSAIEIPTTASTEECKLSKRVRSVRRLVFERGRGVMPISVTPTPLPETMRCAAAATPSHHACSSTSSCAAASSPSSSRAPDLVIVFDQTAVSSALPMDFVHADDALTVRFYDPAAVSREPSPMARLPPMLEMGVVRKCRHMPLDKLAVDLSRVQVISVDDGVQVDLRLPLSTFDTENLTLVAANQATLRLCSGEQTASSPSCRREYHALAKIRANCSDDSLVDLNGAVIGELLVIADATSRICNAVVYKRLEASGGCFESLRNVRRASERTLVLPASLKQARHVRTESFDQNLLIS